MPVSRLKKNEDAEILKWLDSAFINVADSSSMNHIFLYFISKRKKIEVEYAVLLASLVKKIRKKSFISKIAQMKDLSVIYYD